MASCVDDCLYYPVCFDFQGNICDKDLDRFIDYRMTSDGLCEHFKNKADVVEIVRCKNCKLSSEPKSVSRLELYCNNYDVRFCEKEQKIVCGTHFCSHGTPKEEAGYK